MANIQEGDNGDLYQSAGSSGSKNSKIQHIFKIESARYTNGLNVGYKKKRKVKMTPNFSLCNLLKAKIAIYVI